MSEDQRKDFLQMKNEFVNMLKTIKAELQAFETVENETVMLRVCLN